MWMMFAVAALAQEVYLDETTEPMVIDLTGKDASLTFPGDGSVDLASFVVLTTEGEFVLDEWLEKFEVTSKWQAQNLKYTGGGGKTQEVSQTTCVTVLGVKVCVTSS